MRGLMSRGPIKAALIALVLAAIVVTVWLLFVVGREGPPVDTEPAPQDFNFPVEIPPPRGPLAVEVVLEELLGKELAAKEGSRSVAKERLLSQGEAGLAKVKELLGSSDLLVLRFAIDVLADSAAEEALPLLKPFLDHPDPLVRFPAALALLDHGDWSGVLLMAYELGNSEEVRTRRSAAVCLEEIGPSAVPVLVRALSDPAWEVRMNAVHALSDIGDASVAPCIRKVMLEDEERSIRISAARDLYHLTKSQEALELLLRESHSAEWPLRGIAALGLVGAAKAGSEEALTRLVELLADQKQSVRYFVMGGLSEFSADDFGYDYERGPKEQQEAIGRWRAWLEARKERSGQ